MVLHSTLVAHILFLSSAPHWWYISFYVLPHTGGAYARLAHEIYNPLTWL